MEKKQVLERLALNREELRSMGIVSLLLFGSVARDEATAESDVDLLVEFGRAPGLFEFVRIQNRLSEILGGRVDLVTVNALREEMRERILAEAIRAA